MSISIQTSADPVLTPAAGSFGSWGKFAGHRELLSFCGEQPDYSPAVATGRQRLVTSEQSHALSL
jgi:hypothetical protein